MTALAAGVLGLALLYAAPAHSRTVTLRWREPSPTPGHPVAGFKVYVHYVDQPWQLRLDAGLPPARDGVYSLELDVSDADATWVAVTAYDAKGLESPRSNEKLFLLPEPGERDRRPAGR